MGELLAKRNYRQVKRQKEEARKTRQQQKQQRRSTPGTLPGVEEAPASTALDGEAVEAAPLVGPFSS
jgi:hypothetical protein